MRVCVLWHCWNVDFSGDQYRSCAGYDKWELNSDEQSARRAHWGSSFLNFALESAVFALLPI